MLSDGKTVYLSDFGLVLDKEFNLNDKDLEFFSQNGYYDYAYILMQLSDPQFNKIFSGETSKYFADKYKINDKVDETKVRQIVFENLNEICRYLHFDERYPKLLLKYKDITDEMFNFLTQMRNSDKKDIIFPNQKIKNLLKKICDPKL